MLEKTKKCLGCREERPYEDFYKNNRGGLRARCKVCYLEGQRKIREKNPEKFRARVRRSQAKNPEKVLARGRRSRAKNPQRHRDRQRLYKEKYPRVEWAHSTVNNAIKAGKLERATSCEECESSRRIQAHHDDYLKPLSVRWLCNRCHRRWHLDRGPGLNKEGPVSQ